MAPIEKPLCIIPARGGSKRFPRKNVAQLLGKPLLAYAVESALESDVFDTVCVSSDDDEILKVAKEYGALALKRPAELAGDTVQVKQVVRYLLEHFASEGKDYSVFGLLLPTNPLRTAEDVRKAYEILKENDANYVMSVIPHSDPPQRAVCVKEGYLEPYFGVEYMKTAQQLEPLYHDDGSVIFAKSAAFLKEGEFYGSKVMPYFMPPERSVDIDQPHELELAEFLLRKHRD